MESAGKYFLLVLLALQCLSAASLFGGGSGDEYDESDYEDEDEKKLVAVPAPSDACVAVPKTGVEWVMSEWKGERGWGEQTPRALIVLAMAGLTNISPAQVRQMELQLDVEITTMLLRNHSHPLHPTDLVLFVQALLAMGRNPRDFYGRDLVALLLLRSPPDHPVLLLGLCDARAATQHHVHFAERLLHGYLGQNNVDYLALALKACSCLKSLDLVVNEKLITDAQNRLISLQLEDGSFGNLYTTSLVVQALASCTLQWDQKAALRFLDSGSRQHPNMVLVYHILMAEHSGRFPFVKDIHPDLDIEPVVPKRDDGVFVQFTVKTAPVPDYYHTISIKMPRTASFFDVMKASQMHDSKFKFESYEDKNNLQHVYSISGVPNDAEGNLYWHLCLQTNVNHVSHVYDIRTVTQSPTQVTLKDNDHFIYWFRDTLCNQSSQIIY